MPPRRPPLTPADCTRQFPSANTWRRCSVSRWLALLAVCLLLVAIPQTATQQPAGATVFGPKNYVRSTGKPFVVTDAFTVGRPVVYTLRIDNGGVRGEFERVSSAVVTLNSVVVVAPSE